MKKNEFQIKTGTTEIHGNWEQGIIKYHKEIRQRSRDKNDVLGLEQYEIQGAGHTQYFKITNFYSDILIEKNGFRLKRGITVYHGNWQQESIKCPEEMRQRSGVKEYSRTEEWCNMQIQCAVHILHFTIGWKRHIQYIRHIHIKLTKERKIYIFPLDGEQTMDFFLLTRENSQFSWGKIISSHNIFRENFSDCLGNVVFLKKILRIVLLLEFLKHAAKID